MVICTLNEETNLPHVLPRIPEWVHEVLLVDGHSTDNTIARARELLPRVRVLTQPGKGKGDALKYGVQQATGDIVVTLDADGATEPEDLPRFIEPLLAGYDFVKGSRFRRAFPENKPFHRIVGNWIITLTFDALFLARYTDICSGYNAFRRDRVGSLDIWPNDGFENEPLINARVRKKGLKVMEVGHKDPGRMDGEVKEAEPEAGTEGHQVHHPGEVQWLTPCCFPW